MGLQRKIINQLAQWRNSIAHFPVVMYGARQIGKTYTLKQFGKRFFRNTVYINFERDHILDDVFEKSLSPAYIIKKLSEEFAVNITPEDTFIIFDEIQASERALTSLKYFAEDAPEYYIVAAGSIIGVKINREKFSFPVGKVKLLNMYPMDFEEFLLAADEEILCSKIKRCYEFNQPMEESEHERALKLYNDFLLTGGMPAAVKAYVTNDDYRVYQRDIYDMYIADMAKYSEPETHIKIVKAYKSLPEQLAKENKKFQYKIVEKGGRASTFELPIYWLLQARIALRCTLVQQGVFPLSVQEENSFFKLYYSDTGLFAAETGMTREKLADSRQFMGAFTENYLAATLAANGYRLCYWTSEGTAEVDFLIERHGEVVPVECKAGVHVKSKSLHLFMKKYNLQYGIRVSARNFGFEAGIKSVPLYAAFCI